MNVYSGKQIVIDFFCFQYILVISYLAKTKTMAGGIIIWKYPFTGTADLRFFRAFSFSLTIIRRNFHYFALIFTILMKFQLWFGFIEQSRGYLLFFDAHQALIRILNNFVKD